jgi:tRNA A37 threonylcarbamoyladenosine dehydratase
MAEWTEKSQLYSKKEGLDNLKNTNIYMVVGLGGVGSLQLNFGKSGRNHDYC